MKEEELIEAITAACEGERALRERVVIDHDDDADAEETRGLVKRYFSEMGVHGDEVHEHIAERAAEKALEVFKISQTHTMDAAMGAMLAGDMSKSIQLIASDFAMAWVNGIVVGMMLEGQIRFDLDLPLAPWETGNFWRVIDSDGNLRAESSDEDEVRERMRAGDRLEREFHRSEAKWELVEDE